jgi:hypothetical protein
MSNADQSSHHSLEPTPQGAGEKVLSQGKNGMKQIAKGNVNGVSLWGALIGYTL